MPQRPRIGEILRRSVPLSRQDVDEILEDQKTTRRRFGEIALSWGLCQPEQLWTAWCKQLTDDLERIDLRAVGIDAQAAAEIPPDVARRLRVVPVRMSESTIIVACDEPLGDQCLAELKALLGLRVKYVLTGTAELSAAIDEYYPALQPTG